MAAVIRLLPATPLANAHTDPRRQRCGSCAHRDLESTAQPMPSPAHNVPASTQCGDAQPGDSRLAPPGPSPSICHTSPNHALHGSRQCNAWPRSIQLARIPTCHHQGSVKPEDARSARTFNARSLLLDRENSAPLARSPHIKRQVRSNASKTWR
ncbi:hypothetical protein BCR44DRAFT_1428771 [Catenaria anguillulae PL171]|uniref:Uncharacterized protein n=1 Tax=Catenaria anguillulae PL171 TaxID=765915 RepID=A0A1Y2HY69_9FUNG|nr:hypothetical protein BCR44DRAFT_1428771 [Catenaria anguillulae PL171]